MKLLCYSKITMATNNNMVPKGTEDFSVGQIILRTAVSTSLRVFGPILVLLAIGMIIDSHFDHSPVGMLVGASTGAVIAGVLVYLQIKQVERIKK